MIGAEGELARRAAGRGDEKDFFEAGLDIALPVGAIGEEVANLERFGPFCAFGFVRRSAAEFRPFVLYQHRVGDRAAVGGPGQARRAGRKSSQAHRFTAVHPAHPELRAATFGRGEGEALAVGRPARRKGAAAAPGNRRFLARRRVDQPDRADRAVGHDVVRATDISDVAAVGADLRVGGDRQVEQVGAGEAAFGAFAGAADGGSRCGGRCAGFGGGSGRRRFFLRETELRGEGEEARPEQCQFAHEMLPLFATGGWSELFAGSGQPSVAAADWLLKTGYALSQGDRTIGRGRRWTWPCGRLILKQEAR